MNESYIDLTLSIPPDAALRETVSYQLHDLGFTGMLEDDSGVHWYIPKSLWTPGLREEMRAVWQSHLPHTISIESTREIENRNWNQLWEESLTPIAVTGRILITPSWHPVERDSHDIILTIDPKMSFGTGYHESTRLMLRLLERYVVPGSTVLDVGTGTGILAIAAVNLGARSAVGIDIDEWSSSNGKENVERNGLAERIEIRQGSVEVVRETLFTMILANITRNAIIELLPSMLARLERHGRLLLSGLMADDQEIIAAALRQLHCSVETVIAENEWIGMAVQPN